jgi:peroxiredoxin
VIEKCLRGCMGARLRTLTGPTLPMPLAKALKNPLVFVPLMVGVILPCATLLVLRFARAPKPPASDLKFKDAVVISGQPLPSTELLQLNGEKVPPEILRKGKVVLVFMTTHCQPCQKEFKILSSLQPSTSAKVKIYGVGVEDRSLIVDFIKEQGVSTDIVLDQHAQLMKSLSVKYFPTSFLVEDGIITRTWFGNEASENDFMRHLGW